MFRTDIENARKTWLESLPVKQRVEADSSDFLKTLNSENESLDFHALRHTCASWLIQADADVKTVQSIMRMLTSSLPLNVTAIISPAVKRRLCHAFGMLSHHKSYRRPAQMVSKSVSRTVRSQSAKLCILSARLRNKTKGNGNGKNATFPRK